jgi:hypothetical protein
LNNITVIGRVKDAVGRPLKRPSVEPAPREILTPPRDARSKKVVHVSAAALAERYITARTDAVRPFSNVEEVLVAPT